MIHFLDNLSGRVESVKPDPVPCYGEEVLSAGWNPALKELRACLLTVADAERERKRRDGKSR